MATTVDRSPRRSAWSSPRVVVGHRARDRDDRRSSLRLLGIRRGWGTALLAGLLGWGLRRLLALGLADWDWGADGLVVHTLAIAIPATMAAAVTLDLLARPGLARAPASAPGLVVAPAPAPGASAGRIAVLRRYRELSRLARREGFGPFMSPAGRAGRSRRRASACGCAACSRRPVASTSSSVRSPPPASTCCRPRSATSWPSCRTASRRSRVDASEPVLEAELGATVDEVFAEFDWEPLAAASIGQTHRARLRTGRGGRRQGAAARHRADDGARPRRARAARRRRAAAHAVRPGRAVGEMLDQFAQGLRAELDFRQRGRRHGRDGAAARRGLVGAGPAGLPAAVHPAAARAGALRGLHGRRHEPARRRRRSTGRRSPSSCCARRSIRCCGSASSTPTRTRATSSSSPTGRSVSSTSARSGGSTRSSKPAVIDMLAAIVRRDVSLLRDGIERVADCRRRPVRRAARAGARPAAWPITCGPPARSSRSVLQDLVRDARASSASGCRPTLWCCRARSSRSTARCACSRPTSRSCRPRPR